MITEQLLIRTEHFLSNNPGIRADQMILARIFQRCEFSWHRAGQTVCTDSRQGRSVFFLFSGTVSVYEGEERLLDLEAPTLLGLMSQPQRMLLCIATSRVCIGRMAEADSAALSADETELGALYRSMLLRSGVTPA